MIKLREILIRGNNVIKRISSLLLITCLSFSIVTFNKISQARYTSHPDASVEYEIYNVDVKVEKDDEREYIEEIQIKILNDYGRHVGTQEFNYNSNIQTVELIEGKTIVNGVEYKVDPSMIENKPVASNIKGFDDLNKLQVSFPNVVVGSSIYFKIKSKIFKSELPGLYFDNFSFGDRYTLNGNVSVKSKIKFHTFVNDPGKHLKITQKQQGEYQTLNISLTKPVFTSIVGEGDTFLLEKQKTFVSVSSLNSYEDYAKQVSPYYEKVLKETLPESLQKIVAEAKLLNNSVDQINLVTSKLAEQVRYMGDWRTVDGKIFPRSLSAVSSSGYGDCKDFATNTAAMLRKLEYKANVAFVYRGSGYYTEKFDITNPSSFNHAIVRVEDKSGKIFWIDPTNFVSMANGIFPDIENRPALVVDEQNPKYTMIPAINYKDSTINTTKVITIKPDNSCLIHGNSEIAGENAIQITGLEQMTSKQYIEESLIENVSGELSPLNWSIQLPDLNSRIVKPLSIGFSFEQSNKILLTNAGSAIVMGSPNSTGLINIARDQIGCKFIGNPETYIRNTTLKDVEVNDISSLNAEVQSPWYRINRTCKMVNKDAQCTEKSEILRSFVTGDEARSKEFEKVREDLKKYFYDTILIFSKAKN
jgi:hypothetical protein